MKHIIKTVAAATAALAMISCSSAVVGAAEKLPGSQIKIVCKDGSCRNISELLDKCCGQNCDWNELIKAVRGYGPNGNCSVEKPSQPAVQT